MNSAKLKDLSNQSKELLTSLRIQPYGWARETIYCSECQLMYHYRVYSIFINIIQIPNKQFQFYYYFVRIINHKGFITLAVRRTQPPLTSLAQLGNTAQIPKPANKDKQKTWLRYNQSRLCTVRNYDVLRQFDNSTKTLF